MVHRLSSPAPAERPGGRVRIREIRGKLLRQSYGVSRPALRSSHTTHTKKWWGSRSKATARPTLLLLLLLRQRLHWVRLGHLQFLSQSVQLGFQFLLRGRVLGLAVEAGHLVRVAVAVEQFPVIDARLVEVDELVTAGDDSVVPADRLRAGELVV